MSGRSGSWPVFAARSQHGEAVARRVSWYGKLPARGDFVGRGLPPRWRSDWDDWLQRGLALAATTLDDAALRERLRAFAPWRYLALPAPGEIWCGIMVASHDRVGRAFPLTLAERFAGPSSPGESAARLASLLGAAAEGPEALEAAIAALPPRSGQEFQPAEALAVATGQPLVAARRCARCHSPDGGLAPGTGAAARTARYSIARTPDRERRIVVLIAAVGLLHSRFEALEPGLNAAAADHTARHREIVEGRPEAVAAQQQRIA